MKAVTKITFLDERNEKFFGEGPCRLLREVERSGSLRSAASSMEMAYTKALKLIKNAEQSLGFPLLHRAVGGRAGGGSVLTEEGAAWLERYEAYRDACVQANEALFQSFFPPKKSFGCVIMASGEGKRFGGNKLLAELDGKPLIQWAIEVTGGLFDRRVVVTRHKEVEELCRRKNVPVLLHAQPYRGDTVRLGLEALGTELDGCVFLPSDQPLLRRETLQRLIKSAEEAPEVIWRAAYGEESGAPVLFPKALYGELLTLPQGKGGGVLLKKYPELVRLVQTAEEWELWDIDTPEALERAKGVRRELGGRS